MERAVAATGVSAAFLQADKLRLDIEHKLTQLEDRATAVLQAFNNSEDGNARAFELQGQLEQTVHNAIAELGKRVADAEGLVEKEPAAKREMWREYAPAVPRATLVCRLSSSLLCRS